jgi:hypothetical protein
VAGGTQPSRRHGECFRAIDERTNEERAAIGHELVFVGLELSQVLATRELTERLMDELPELVAAGDGRASELAGRLRSFGVNPVAPAYSYRASGGRFGRSRCGLTNGTDRDSRTRSTQRRASGDAGSHPPACRS